MQTSHLMGWLLLLLCACGEQRSKLAFPEPIKTDFCQNIEDNDTMTLSQALADLNDRMQHQTGVYVLEDGDGSMVSRAWLCDHAEERIDIQYFIFSTDNVGLIACDYLVRAADRGVKVRILIDDIMVEAEVSDVLSLDAHPNIDVKIYNPGINLGKTIVEKVGKLAFDFRDANQRMHNKSFTVDGKVSITGGRNVADEYFDYDHDFNFRDRDVLLIGKAAQDVAASFETYWAHEISVPVQSLTDDPPLEVDDHTYDRLHAYACDPANFWPQVRQRIQHLPQAFEELKQSGEIVWLDRVVYVADTPGKNDGKDGLGGGGITTDTLIGMVQNASKSIDIQTPYLIMTEAGQQLFSDAVKRGVKVRILTNSLASTDNLQAFSGYQSEREEILETGVEVYEFKPDAAKRHEIMTGDLHEKLEHTPTFGLHAKSMVIDGEVTVIGTFNLDPRSANLNTECITVLYSEEIAKRVGEQMESEFQPENAWRITKDFNPDDEVEPMKRAKTWTMKALPKDIL